MISKFKRTGISKSYSDYKDVEIPSIGVVRFVSSKRAKHLSITIKNDLSIRVAVPKGMTLTTAQKFFQSKIDWVKRHLKKMQSQKMQPVQPKLDVRAIDQRRAIKDLTERLDYLADKHGFTFNRVFIRNQRTRWGSCSSKDNISLNINLVQLPQELQDYVILHELVHTKHKNHSKKFWAAMDKLIGDSKQFRKQMRKYRLK